MKPATLLLVLAPVILAAPTGKREAEAAPPAGGYGNYGDYPPPAGGYGSYGAYPGAGTPSPPPPATGYGTYGSYPAPSGGYATYGAYKRAVEWVKSIFA